MIVFGPIPSRRLGRSLGINNIPPKTCTYSCVYCQVGKTDRMTLRRREFYAPERIAAEAAQRVREVRAAGGGIDYLTFVADGEPTLDLNLEETIRRLAPLGVPVAVITNASLLSRAPVRRALASAAWVSVKVDAVDEAAWRKIDRPHGRLRLAEVLEGIAAFSRDYRGRLVTETMLVEGLNDGRAAVEKTAAFVAGIAPAAACISIPTRPPAESGVRPPSPEVRREACVLFAAGGTPVEALFGAEEGDFQGAPDAAEGLLAIAAVHPMRESAVEEYLRSRGEDEALVRSLVAAGRLVRIEYGGEVFYRRSHPRSRS
ncbi:MAG TPA: radical SAM protein [bacterium]|nr:radical SAM protein [bacterium]